MMRQFRLRYALPLLVMPLLLAGCPWLTGGQLNPPADPELKAFASASELLNYFKDQANTRNSFRGGWNLFGIMPLATGGAAFEDQAAESGGDSYSTTNIQEAGVDESDVIKTDGTYFYVAKDSSLRVVQVDAPAQVGQLDFDTPIDSMYLLDSKLILLGRSYSEDYWGPANMPAIEIWPPYYPATGVVVYEVDITDPTNPTLTKQLELDGSLATSRMTNNRLILVLSIAPELPTPTDPITIGMMTLEQVMPKARANGSESDMVDWEDWLYPSDADGYFMTSVVTLDVADIETIMDSVGVMAQAGTVYASTEAIYLTNTGYDYQRSSSRTFTAIHKLSFDDQGVAQYVGSGAVPGRLLNQFSLGEYNDNLRVATHVPAEFTWWFGGGDAVGIAVANAADGGTVADRSQAIDPSVAYNAVYVLAEQNAALEVVGYVNNIAPNEDLHAARFLANYGYVVTFRKIDPLYVLDLTDPTNPTIVGELKVPGFSDYLHPVDDTHLIGVGKYTSPTDQGFDWFQGVQISLFDVSDMTNPTAVEQITLGGRGSYCEVDYTHKAFTYLAETNTLALPMHLYTLEEPPWQWGELYFDGVVVFEVDTATGFTELGRLAAPANEAQGYYYYSSGWRRAAINGNVVYALSEDGVNSAPLTDFENVTNLEFQD